jgi:hypothetical protein
MDKEKEGVLNMITEGVSSAPTSLVDAVTGRTEKPRRRRKRSTTKKDDNQAGQGEAFRWWQTVCCCHGSQSYEKICGEAGKGEAI